MAYCTKCGAELQEGARFCSKCGAPVYGGGGTEYIKSAFVTGNIKSACGQQVFTKKDP